MLLAHAHGVEHGEGKRDVVDFSFSLRVGVGVQSQILALAQALMSRAQNDRLPFTPLSAVLNLAHGGCDLSSTAALGVFVFHREVIQWRIMLHSHHPLQPPLSIKTLCMRISMRMHKVQASCATTHLFMNISGLYVVKSNLHSNLNQFNFDQSGIWIW